MCLVQRPSYVGAKIRVRCELGGARYGFWSSGRTTIRCVAQASACGGPRTIFDPGMKMCVKMYVYVSVSYTHLRAHETDQYL
eukprot:872921-Amorphochlora_amoeboformis.AAC.1